MSTPIFSPTYLIEALGEIGKLPDGAIINAGGVSGTTFTVGGRGLLFTDGTSSDGTAGINLDIDFQSAYTNSIGEAFIQTAASKDIVFNSVNNKQFRFDSDTGTVSITGDLTVLGTVTAIINTEANVERLQIHQTDGGLTPFIMEPIMGVTPTVNVVDIKTVYGGASVFTISPGGVTYIQSLNTGGPINGVNLGALQAQVNAHENLSSTATKHTAVQIAADTTGLISVSGTNVQEVIESIDSALSTAIGQVRAYEHVQTVTAPVWQIVHAMNTKRIQVSIWDSTDELIFADTVKITDNNTVQIVFNEAITGRAILMLF